MDKRAKSPEQFLEEIEEKGFVDRVEITWLDTYVNNATPMRFLCTTHGEQKVRPNSLISRNSKRSHICGLCCKAATKGKPKLRRLTYEVALQRVQERHNGTVELDCTKDEFKGSGSMVNGKFVSHKYNFHCLVEGCGHEWPARGEHVWGSKGTGCQECKARTQSKEQREKGEQKCLEWFTERPTMSLHSMEHKKIPNASVKLGYVYELYVSLQYDCKDQHVSEKPVRFQNLVAGNRCPECSETGYKTSKPGTFYLTEVWRGSDDAPVVNIGISNNGWQRRYSSTSKDLFIVTYSVFCEDGTLPDELESFLKEELAALNYTGPALLEDKGTTEFFELNTQQRSGLLSMMLDVGDSHHCSHPEWVEGTAWEASR
jgi:hypothetical protein